MSDISEFESRITTALERIGVGVDQVLAGNAAQGGGIDADEMEQEIGRLREALETERDSNLQMEERVRAIRDRQETLVAGLETDVKRLREQLTAQDTEFQRLRRVNAQLRTNNRMMREAALAGSVDAHLVNKAMLAELEALHASHSADAAELDAILSDLKPVVEQSES